MKGCQLIISGPVYYVFLGWFFCLDKILVRESRFLCTPKHTHGLSTIAGLTEVE